MKAYELLKAFAFQGCSEEMGIIHIPDENSAYRQDEEWWITNFGTLPPAPIPAGVYVFIENLFGGCVSDENQTYLPDVELESEDGSFSLFRIDDAE